MTKKNFPEPVFDNMIISEQDFLEVYAHSDRYFKVKLEMANMCSHFDSFRLFCMFLNVKKESNEIA